MLWYINVGMELDVVEEQKKCCRLDGFLEFSLQHSLLNGISTYLDCQGFRLGVKGG